MRNYRIRMLSSVGSALVMLILAGCQTSSKDERSEGRALDDKDITENVEKALQNEPTYKFTDVQVSTFAGIVQLSGFVNVEGQKMRAQQITLNTEGVREVVNGLTLKPMMPATARVTVAQPIYAEPQNAPAASQPKNAPNQNMDQK